MNHRAFWDVELRDGFLTLPFLEGRAAELVMGDAMCEWLRWP